MISFNNLVIGGLVIAQIGWSVLAFRQSRTELDIARELRELRAAVATEAALVAENEKAVKRLQGTVEALGKLPIPAEIALAMTSGSDLPIFGLVSERLKADSKFRELVRGEKGAPGKNAEPKEIVLGLLGCCTEELGVALWSAGRSELIRHQGVLADVASQVYQKYHNDLKGADGRSPTASDISNLLANDIGFAKLVADVRR